MVALGVTCQRKDPISTIYCIIYIYILSVCVYIYPYIALYTLLYRPPPDLLRRSATASCVVAAPRRERDAEAVPRAMQKKMKQLLEETHRSEMWEIQRNGLCFLFWFLSM